MLSRDRRLMDVTYRVEEGAQYRIGSGNNFWGYVA